MRHGRLIITPNGTVKEEDWKLPHISPIHKKGSRAIVIVIVIVIGLYRENAIAIESEARDPFRGNVYYVTMQKVPHSGNCA